MQTLGLIGAGHIGSQLARLAIKNGYAVVDPQPWMCTSTRCAAVIANRMVYRDSTDLTAAFSAWLAPLVQPLLHSDRAGS